MMSSTIPSAKYSCSGSPLMFWNASTAIEGFSGSASRGDGLLPARHTPTSRPRRSADADFKRIDPYSARRCSSVASGQGRLTAEFEPRPHLAIGVLGKTDRAWLGDAFQPSCDVDAVAHQIAVALLDHIAEVNADRNTMRRSSGRPALRSTMPFCTSMAQRTASTTLRNSMIAPSPVRLTTRPLCAAKVGVDQIAPKPSQARQRAILIGASEPRVPTTSATKIAASFRVPVIAQFSNMQT